MTLNFVFTAVTVRINDDFSIEILGCLLEGRQSMTMVSRFIPNLPFLVSTFVHVTWY